MYNSMQAKRWKCLFIVIFWNRLFTFSLWWILSIFVNKMAFPNCYIHRSAYILLKQRQTLLQNICLRIMLHCVWWPVNDYLNHPCGMWNSNRLLVVNKAFLYVAQGIFYLSQNMNWRKEKKYEKKYKYCS